VQRPPRDSLSAIFLLQGIHVDPQLLGYAVDRIVSCCDIGYGDGVSRYDCFLNYRVSSDRDLVEKVYWQLRAKGAFPFWDSACLRDGEDWRQGFLRGLQSSRSFVAVLSRQALEPMRRLDADHSADNVLLEYEAALRIKQVVGRPNYFLPLLVGEYVQVRTSQQSSRCSA